MPSINDAYINALLADACYVNDLVPGMTGSDLAVQIRGRMTPTIATYIGNNFTAVQQEGGSASSFDSTVWRGNAGTQCAGLIFVTQTFTFDVPPASQ